MHDTQCRLCHCHHHDNHDQFCGLHMELENGLDGISCSSVVEPGLALTKTQHVKKNGVRYSLQFCRSPNLGEGPRIMGLGP